MKILKIGWACHRCGNTGNISDYCENCRGNRT